MNRAYANTHWEDSPGHFNVFVGGLSLEVTDATLFAWFSVYPSCSDAKIMWDLKTGWTKDMVLFLSFYAKACARNFKKIEKTNGTRQRSKLFFTGTLVTCSINGSEHKTE